VQGISKKKPVAIQKWTPELDKKLRQLAGTKGKADVAAQMGRTVRGIEKRAGRLGISLAFHAGAHAQWSPADDARLKELAGTMPITQIATTLNRSRFAVIDRGVFLGVPVGFVRTPASRQRWDEIKVLVSEGLAAPQIARRLGIALHTIRQRLHKMALKPLKDGRGCQAGRKVTSVSRRPKQAPVVRITTTVSRLAKCDGCGLWVINTFEGWAAHRARLHASQKEAA
jgi:hypothetical protein